MSLKQHMSRPCFHFLQGESSYIGGSRLRVNEEADMELVVAADDGGFKEATGVNHEILSLFVGGMHQQVIVGEWTMTHNNVSEVQLFRLRILFNS